MQPTNPSNRPLKNRRYPRLSLAVNPCSHPLIPRGAVAGLCKSYPHGDTTVRPDYLPVSGAVDYSSWHGRLADFLGRDEKNAKYFPAWGVNAGAVQ